MNNFEHLLKMENKEENESENKSGSNAVASIELLNDDCLIEIFKHLSSVSDKVRIERGNFSIYKFYM